MTAGPGQPRPRPPAHLANENKDSIIPQPARAELPDHDLPSTDAGWPDEGDGAEREIEIEFRRKLAGLRRLPRHERILALLAARAWRSLALNALREKRAIDRHAPYMQHRHNQMLAPR